MTEVEFMAVANELRVRADVSEVEAVRVFWITFQGLAFQGRSRELFASEVHERLNDGPRVVIPYIPRDHAFFSVGNAVPNDIVCILNDNQAELEARNRERRVVGVDIVVISRAPLPVANTGSPAELPDWFPIRGGEVVHVPIHDLTWSVSVQVNDQASRIDELTMVLHHIDRELLNCLRVRLERGQNNQIRGLWNFIRKSEGEQAAGAADTMIKTMESSPLIGAYRPELKNPTSMVERLWRSAGQTAPDSLSKLAKSLNNFLGVSHLSKENVSIQTLRFPLIVVFCRPAHRISDSDLWWSIAFIITLRSACQIITASHHFGDYPSFPILQLRSTSSDLYQYLERALQRIRLCVQLAADQPVSRES